MSSVPKSEYLRHALQARRTQNPGIKSTPTLTPMDLSTPSRPAAPTPSAALHTPEASPDAFDEFDLPDELMAPESPIRKRRPHEKDDTPPRGKTNLELSAEVEMLRDELIKQNIRVELLKKNNHELQAKWVQAKEEVDQLKPLKEENFELRAENKALSEKLDSLADCEEQLDEMNSELDQVLAAGQALQESNAALQEEVLNLKKVNDEAKAEFEDQEDALNEAVEMITGLESEKKELSDEVEDLKKRVAAIESRQLDGSAKYPQRVYSIDEQRPATSYDDSDYYSQPATPRAKPDMDAQSVHSTTSVQSKRFIELTKERTRSARSLSKRLSDASLRASSVISAVHAPEIPQIPEEYTEVTPRTVDERFRERRYRQTPGLEKVVADMRRTSTVTPVQTHQPSGLRSLYRPDQQLQRSNTTRAPPTYAPSSGRSSKPRNKSVTELSPVPPRTSSRRHAQTTSEDRLRPRTSDATFDSHTTTGTGTLVGSEEPEPEPEPEQEQVLTAWTSVNPRTSSVCLLTSSPNLDRPDRERWWKDTENVRPLLRTRATTKTLRADFSSDEGDSASRTFAARADGVRTNPSTPATEKPEKDFLFNPRETEEQFMRKTISKLKGSIRRRHHESD